MADPQAEALTPLPRVERWFASTRAGTRLCAVSWPLSAGSPPPRGALVLAHGYGHYAAPLFDWLATLLAARGYACWALEHVGHGKSEGLRAYVPNFDALVEDLLRFVATVRARDLPAGTPVFLYGESLGGAICLHAALRAPSAFSGLVLLSPMTAAAAGVEPHWLIVLIGRLAALAMPAAAIAPVRDILPLCFRDESFVPVARADTRRYAGRMRLGTAFAFKDAIAALSVQGATLATPMLLMHGTGDAVTSHEASERLFESCASRDKTLLRFEGAFHVLWAEPADTRLRMLTELSDWLGARCDPALRAKTAKDGAALSRLHTYPLGALPFHEFLNAETRHFTSATHGHLVTDLPPEGDMVPLGEAEAAAVLATMPPRIEAR